MKEMLVPLIFLVLLAALLTPLPLEGQASSSLTHKKLIVGVIDDPPFAIKNERGQWTGFNVDLWRYMAVDLGIDYEFREMTFKTIQDGLRNGTIDLSIAALYETAARYRLFDFSTTVGMERLAVAVPADKDSHALLGAGKTFFSWGVIKILALFLVVLFGLGLILWLIERNRNPEDFGGRPAKGIGTGAYWVSSALAAGACYDVTLKSLPARIIGLIWIFLGALAFSAFTASLASTLLIQSQSMEVYDAKKLRSLRLGVLRDSLQHTLLKDINGKYRVFNDESGLMAAMRAKKIEGLFMGELTLHYYAGREFERPLRIHPTEFKPHRFAFAFPRGSLLRKPVNLALTEIMERPEWEALATRYGLDNNLEPKQMSLGKKSRFSR